VDSVEEGYWFPFAKEPETNKGDETNKGEEIYNITSPAGNATENPTGNATGPTSNTIGKKESIGQITVKQLPSGKYLVTFRLSEEEKKKRLHQLLEAIKNGFAVQSSNELNSLVPLFLVAAVVKVPAPVFHSYLHIAKRCDGTVRVLGLADGLENPWVTQSVGNGQSSVYVFESGRVSWDAVEKKGACGKFTQSWEEFWGEPSESPKPES